MNAITVVGKARLAMARAIEVTERGAALPCRPTSLSLAPTATKRRMVGADLPRICAVHDQGYVARYIADPEGHFQYAQSFRYKTQLSEQYESQERVTVPSNQLADETCPWCGAVGRASIRCGTCLAEICYGRTTAGRHFTCRDSCAGSGSVVPKRRDMEGFNPGLVASGPGGT